MPNWKKVIVSGSNAHLNQVTASYFSGDGSGLTGTGVSVSDEGTEIVSAATSINFVGSGVTATTSGDNVTATISAIEMTLEEDSNGDLQPVLDFDSNEILMSEFHPLSAFYEFDGNNDIQPR